MTAFLVMGAISMYLFFQGCFSPGRIVGNTRYASPQISFNDFLQIGLRLLLVP